MPQIQLNLTDEESQKLALYVIEHKLASKKEAIKKLIGELKIAVKMEKARK